MKVGINGMGRIGRLALRAALGAAERETTDPRADNRLQVVHLNELKGGAAATAHLLAFDSVQGKWRADIAAEGEDSIRIDQHRMGFSAHAAPGDIPWGELGVELVLECTGKFLTPETLQGHLDRGAKRVIVAAPVKVGNVLNIVVGVNDHLYNPARDRIVTAASCTTNCLAPVVKVLYDAFGLEYGLMTTCHSYTMDQRLLDGSHSDFRRARAACLSMIPTSTGAARAVTEVMPELAGRLDGLSVRVPTPNVSLVDLVATVTRPTSREEVNQAFVEAAAGFLTGVLDVSFEPLVSTDHNGSGFSAVVDAELTNVLGGTLVKVMAWYDNEMGFANRMLDLASYVGRHVV
ncbi:MAG: type I glyceraldehyde-3-phosphate dehydrogenase [Hydrogenophaga sp.]|nr:type I glyceraldehyde-3-phosphate dehydrogenase [Hydrogenophaga sp.]